MYVRVFVLENVNRGIVSVWISFQSVQLFGRLSIELIETCVHVFLDKRKYFGVFSKKIKWKKRYHGV